MPLIKRDVEDMAKRVANLTPEDLRLLKKKVECSMNKKTPDLRTRRTTSDKNFM